MLYELEISQTRRAVRVVQREQERTGARAERLQRLGRHEEAAIARGDEAALMLARQLAKQEWSHFRTEPIKEKK
jgi:tetraacyldisaccharide-1-P 4'-kinase